MLGIARRRLSSSLATVSTSRTTAIIGEDGLAVLNKTLPIHKDDSQPVAIAPEGAAMIEVTIDGNQVQVQSGYSILQACESVGINIPRFCFHERLSVAGNCRMCLVEIEKSPKPVASCAMPTMPGMKIFTDSPMVKKAREGVMEFMLANHPLDCPICDQGGECDLQDQSMLYGSDRSRFMDDKRSTEDKNLGPLVKTVMTRCIHCTRCVRFSQEVAGVTMLGAVGRGNAMEIGTYVEATLATELSGNVVDLCPVGALTAKPTAFAARSWEYRSTASIDVLDACGPSIKVDTRGGEVMRVQPRTNDDVNEEWISDKTRFAIDGLKRQRLDMPLVRVDGVLKPTTWAHALSIAATEMLATDGSAMGVVAGPLVEVEALVPAMDLFSKLGCNSFGLSAAPTLSADLRASYITNPTIAGIENTDALLIVGSNPRVEAPLLNARLRKLVRHEDLPIGLVGAPCDLTFEYQALGESAETLSSLLSGEGFAATLKSAQRPAILVGTGASPAAIALAKSLAKSVGCLTDGWNGFGLLHSSSSTVGALDVGFVSAPGASATAEQKLVYLIGADEPETISSISDDSFVIYQGHHGDAGAMRADVVFPSAAYTEKSATFVNTEGRVQRTARALDPPGEAREDWSILCALSRVAGTVLPYESIGDVRSRMVEIAPHLADSSGDSISGSSAELAALALEAAAPAESSSAPLKTSVTNFYMTDPVSRSSSTMAKCVEAFGTRV